MLVALAAACVEKTSATFSQRAAVVPDVKKEMLEYLNQQSEAYANGGLSSPRLKPELVCHFHAHYELKSMVRTLLNGSLCFMIRLHFQQRS